MPGYNVEESLCFTREQQTCTTIAKSLSKNKRRQIEKKNQFYMSHYVTFYFEVEITQRNGREHESVIVCARGGDWSRGSFQFTIWHMFASETNQQVEKWISFGRKSKFHSKRRQITKIYVFFLIYWTADDAHLRSFIISADGTLSIESHNDERLPNFTVVFDSLVFFSNFLSLKFLWWMLCIVQAVAFSLPSKNSRPNAK